MLGTYALSSGYYDAYYGKAQKVRTLICRDFDAAFEQVDVLVSPTTPTTAFPIGERADDPMAMYLADLCTIPSDLAGNAAISVALRAGAGGRSAGRAADHGAGAGGRPVLPGRGGGRGRAGAALGRPAADPGERTEQTVTVTELVPYDEALSRYEPVIGLETHVELGTATKMFCGCPTAFGAEPNTAVCPVCLGLPGSLPVTNRAAIEYTIRIGLALNCSIATWCRFARKNYFYPDMPKDFQISQYDEPLCTDGYLDVEVEGESFRVGIERVHLEEDTGKSLHVGGATGRIHGADYSLVDYNRAGIPLVEVVTKPVVGTGKLAPQVARAYVTELRDLLRALGVSDVRMEEGSLRCDVNTSIGAARRRVGHQDRDQERQLAALGRARGPVRDRTAGRRARRGRRHRAGDPALPRGQRHHDLGPEQGRGAGLPLLPRARPGAGRTAADWIESLRAGLPELPAARRARLQAEWDFSDQEMTWLHNAGALDLVGETVAAGASPADARKWWLGELAMHANKSGVELGELGITPVQVARVADLVAAGTLNDKLARQVLDGVLAGEGGPDEIVAARGLAVVSDAGALAEAVDAAIAANPDVAEKIRDGKVAAAGALVGAVMKATKGQADAGRARELILQRLT